LLKEEIEHETQNPSSQSGQAVQLDHDIEKAVEEAMAFIEQRLKPERKSIEGLVSLYQKKLGLTEESLKMEK
jgi:hypothetical protein